ncbi:hypothetical protein [Nitrospira sp. KM1]|uniref:hypothetical protein n=1 Tax=Nitrospira sp. KM1 TaxID=1936990 RepID=UPI001563DA49|nr:hypothetical protein [Nitrospira sp. KM1]
MCEIRAAFTMLWAVRFDAQRIASQAPNETSPVVARTGQVDYHRSQAVDTLSGIAHDLPTKHADPVNWSSQQVQRHG